MAAELGRLLIVDDDHAFAAGLQTDGERLGLSTRAVHDAFAFNEALKDWSPSIIAMDLVMPDSDGLELFRVCARHNYDGQLILMSAGFEVYLRMAEEIATANRLNVVARLPKPFRPKQFAYLLMALI